MSRQVQRPTGSGSFEKSVNSLLDRVNLAFVPQGVLSVEYLYPGQGVSAVALSLQVDGLDIATGTLQVVRIYGSSPYAQVPYVEVREGWQGRLLGKFMMVALDLIAASEPTIAYVELDNYADDPARAASGLYSSYVRRPTKDEDDDWTMVQLQHNQSWWLANRRLAEFAQELEGRGPVSPWAADAPQKLREAMGFQAAGGGARRGKMGTRRHKGKRRRAPRHRRSFTSLIAASPGRRTRRT